MKSLNSKQYALLLQRSLYEYIEKARKEGDSINVDFTLSSLLNALIPIVNKLEKTGKIKLLPEIIKEFNNNISKSNKLDIAFVYSSIPLNVDQTIELKNRLSKLFNKDLEIQNEVDESIPNGLLIKYNDTLIDATVINQLKKSLS